MHHHSKLFCTSLAAVFATGIFFASSYGEDKKPQNSSAVTTPTDEPPTPPEVTRPDYGTYPNDYPFPDDYSKPLPLPDGLTLPDDLKAYSALPQKMSFATKKAPNDQQDLFETQQAFDIFAWKTFIALNWPSEPAHAGQPDTSKLIGSASAASRVWNSYIPPEDVFKPKGATPDPYNPTTAKKQGAMNIAKRTHFLNELDEAFFNLEQPLPPIVDPDNEYIRYEVRLNETEYDYIVKGSSKNGIAYPLFSKIGQRKFIAKGGKIKFPNGCIELKVAWKKMGPNDDKSRFLTRLVDIVENPTGGSEAVTKNVPYGMIAMHIMYLVEGVPQWVWPTFEHIDNAPLSDLRGSTHKVVGEFHLNDPANPQNWKDGKGGTDPSDYNPLKKRYNLFDPATAGNLSAYIGGFSPSSRAAMDATNKLYNKGEGNYYQEKTEQTLTVEKRQPSQITKVITANNDIAASKWTYALNAKMQNILAQGDPKSVWLNYRLVTTQWPSDPNITAKWQGEIDAWNNTHPDPEKQIGPIAAGTIKAGNPAPISLGNAAAETYMQINGSCMNCHSGASLNFPYQDLDGPLLNQKPDANFSFMLQRAQ